MGFRDLTLFNDSLIAKQAWQLMHKIDTLFYRIFKISFSLNVHLWKQKIQPLGHMLGKIFFKVGMSLRGAQNFELVMRKISGSTIGFPLASH